MGVVPILLEELVKLPGVYLSDYRAGARLS